MTTESPRPPHRVLFLCTGNSARSQMAEALLNQKARGRFEAESAGSQPADRVNPLAIEALRKVGIEWKGHAPRSVDGLTRQHWDFVITVCDRAKEACPILPGHPIHAHWGMEDPAEAEGTDEQKLHAFVVARQLIARRLDLMLALPIEKLERLALEQRLRAIAGQTAGATEVPAEHA
ncbi:MAG: arsenate reductase ArsC [Gemmatimonadales bacterium]